MDRHAAWIPWALLGAGLLLAGPGLGQAQTFSSGSTGADGPFNPTSNTTLTLPPNGVFNFTTINIPAGVTVTFARNGANTPVILLATANVTINGILDVSAGSATAYGRPGRGGPGGFDGGPGADGITSTLGGFGLGPGGGGPGNAGGGGGAGHLMAGAAGTGGTPGTAGPAYGSSGLRPILGGSGGGGGGTPLGTAAGGGGGGGGGAIVIASSTSITLNSFPSIRASATTGGDGYGGSGGGAGAGGSGGAIRLIAPTIAGNGQLRAEGGATGYPYNGGQGSNGRIRVEATNLTYTGQTLPLATTGFPQPVFPGTGQPTLTIASVGGIAAPATPSGSILAAPDILLPTGTTNPVEVVLTASNIPLGTAILVTATPQSGARATATSTGLSGSQASSTATASVTLALTQTSVLTASATFPLVASAGGGPIYAEGEEVKWVRVASTFGGGSTVTYLTASGKEVPAASLALGIAGQ